MKTLQPRRAGAAAGLCTVTLLLVVQLLSGCASSRGGDAPAAVVERTSNSTTWATPESLAARAAEAEAADAARRAAAASPGGSSRVATVQVQPKAAAPAEVAHERNENNGLGPVQRVIYFDFDRYDIKDPYKPMLERRAQDLVAHRDHGLIVEGHADERGSREYNLALGQKRAEAVVHALLLLGAQDSQLEAISFGDTRPAVEGSNEIAWSQNRRAELKDR